MSPRIEQRKQCPHCRAALPQPTPRVCPQCAGSLQKRFLSIGCLSSAPPLILALCGLAALFREDSRGSRAHEPQREWVETPPVESESTTSDAGLGRARTPDRGE